MALALVTLVSLTQGAADIGAWSVLVELADQLPLVALESGLTDTQAAIVTDIRLPRLIVGMMVGAMLSLSGGVYQAVFRNPLADPYLLGAAAGAGLGATIAIVWGLTELGSAGFVSAVPLAAFAGALAAVAATYAMGATGGRRTPATLLLAGIAVASFLTALQTYLLQRHVESIRSVYSWLLGRLGSATWADVGQLAPYALATGVAMLAYRRVLDVMRLGDTEAASLGVRPSRVRAVMVVAASLATAAAVSVSGLIGFVGIIVPHAVRMLAGSSNRVVLPLSVVGGAVFLAASDVLGRSLAAPVEIPIGVITAFFGAPFFVAVLRSSKRQVG